MAFARVSPPAVMACSVPLQSPNIDWSKMSCAWTAPSWYSSVQLPPLLAEPVISSLAATSAPVNRASASTSDLPASLAATSQP